VDFAVVMGFMAQGGGNWTVTVKYEDEKGTIGNLREDTKVLLLYNPQEEQRKWEVKEARKKRAREEKEEAEKRRQEKERRMDVRMQTPRDQRPREHIRLEFKFFQQISGFHERRSLC
jgi:hypothetical protein